MNALFEQIVKIHQHLYPTAYAHMFNAISVTRKMGTPVVWLALIVLQGLAPMSSVRAQTDDDVIITFISQSGSTLQQLLAGEPGQGWLLYYSNAVLSQSSAPAIAVHLSNDSAGKIRADVFDRGSDGTNLSIGVMDDESKLMIPANLALTIEPADKRWESNGRTNYNLDITVYGQIAAMWGSLTDAGRLSWPALLESDEPNARIMVRDTNNDGLPDWDWRTMLPEFSNRADYRTNYVESKCKSPIEIDLGVAPEWPYVAAGGAYEQEGSIFRPPIVVDWKLGRIMYFSELVTARHQNCSYTLYSFRRLLPDHQNEVDFESPFAFYDLSEMGIGYPNLIVNTVSFKAGDPIFRWTERSAEDVTSVRYSWRNAVGDGLWDYAVKLTGFHSYDSKTTIASGLTSVDAPGYAETPMWMIERTWPIATFIEMESREYQSSEGIYEWSATSLDERYFMGEAESPDTSAFNDIAIGMRGEYRVLRDEAPSLYFSTIDNRLHLKWAEQGIWRLDDEQIIRVGNLNNDETIDVWLREVMAVPADEDNDQVTVESKVIETLYKLDNHLLYTDGANVALVASDYDPVIFETLPPTDHDTWEAHRSQLAPYETQRRDPTDLLGWLDAFPGPRIEITGASLDNVRITDDGFRFELILDPGYLISGPDFLGLTNLAPGSYIVENSGDTFTVAALVPAELNLDVRQFDMGGGTTATQVTVHNAGTADAPGLTLIADTAREDGTILELTRTPVDALAEETEEVLLDIPASATGATTLRVRLEDMKGQVVAATDLTGTANPSGNPDAILSIGRVPALIPVIALFATLLAVTAVLAIARRREQPAA